MLSTILFTLVRFTVSEETLHALVSGNPERRRALHSIAWGSRDTDAGEVLVTPPLPAEEAAAIRKVFAGAEGVTEIDAAGEYTFGYTDAPESYDGFGTLTLGEEAGERLVAIRTEYLNWQAPRYASGLHRFRPAAPATSTQPSGESPVAEVSGAAVEGDAPAASVMGLDTVVHFRERTRRYVVVRVETIGLTPCFSMIALSGAVKGCHPTAVTVEEVERDADQTVAFTGAAAATLRRKYDDARRMPPSAAVPMAS